MKDNHSNNNLKLLIIIGSGSSVLKGFIPENNYDLIINADRKQNFKVSQKKYSLIMTLRMTIIMIWKLLISKKISKKN